MMIPWLNRTILSPKTRLLAARQYAAATALGALPGSAAASQLSPATMHAVQALTQQTQQQQPQPQRHHQQVNMIK